MPGGVDGVHKGSTQKMERRHTNVDVQPTKNLFLLVTRICVYDIHSGTMLSVPFHPRLTTETR